MYQLSSKPTLSFFQMSDISLASYSCLLCPENKMTLTTTIMFLSSCLLVAPVSAFCYPLRRQRDIVLPVSVHSSDCPFCLFAHIFCPSRIIFQYLLVRFDAFLFKDSQYPISFVKIDSLTLELLPLS